MMNIDSEKQERVLDAFRRWGYLQANLDPLGHFTPLAHPELDIPGSAADAARRVYSGSIGVEFMHIPDLEKRQWIQERMEADRQESIDRSRILDQLVRADVFEQTIHSRYIGTKRYSLEGNTALIPLLDEILNSATGYGAEQAVLAMSHRGRLNVIINIVNRPAGRSVCRIRGCRSAQRAGRRRREVSHRRDRRVHRRKWEAGTDSPGL